VHAGLVIFAITYIALSVGRIGRVALPRAWAALLGAAAALLSRALSPREAVMSVDIDTLVLLASVMGIGAFLEFDGFFERAAAFSLAHARTPKRLLAFLMIASGALSALVTNDAICILFAPIVVEWIQKHRLPRTPFLIALATSANTGSVATLVGNPQNMLCAHLGSLGFASYAMHAIPIAAAGLAINYVVIAFLFRHELSAMSASLEAVSAPRVLTRSSSWTLIVIFGTVVAYTARANLAYTALTGFLILLLTQRRPIKRVAARIDAPLLLFFVGLFVVVEAFVKSGAPAIFFARVPLASSFEPLAATLRTSAIFLVGSNIVTNVPFILIAKGEIQRSANPTAMWELLAVVSTFAGNLTLLGSVANVIVAEKSRAIGGIGFLDYIKVGVPVALLTTLIGASWLHLFG